MSEKASLFDNERMIAWVQYFAARTDMDVETVKLNTRSSVNKNLIPAVESNRYVLAFADAARPTLFYDMWNAGLGACDVWLKEGPDPAGDAAPCKISSLIDRGIEGPTVLLIYNPEADSSYKIGLQNQRFSKGSVRYVAHEIRAVIMSMLEVRSHDTICIISGESIAVEAAMSAGEGAIIAVEYDESDPRLHGGKRQQVRIEQRADRARREGGNAEKAARAVHGLHRGHGQPGAGDARPAGVQSQHPLYDLHSGAEHPGQDPGPV